MRISNPFRYSFRAPYQSVMCVYKCFFGKRYFIFTAKALHSSVNQLAVELDRRLRLGVTEDSIHYKMIKYIRSARIGLFEVEVVLETESPLDMLKTAHKLLHKAKNDSLCLNMTFDPYVSAWVPVMDKDAYISWAKSYGKRATVKKKASTKKDVVKKKASTKKDVVKKKASTKKDVVKKK